MNADRIISMVIRMVMRRVMRTGVDAGINAVGKRMNRNKDPEKRGKAPDSSESTRRAKKSIRLARRFGRF